MSRIGARFASLKEAGDGALIVFLVAGHPDVETCLAALLAVADAGADVIELGIPFSDPLADGPVIQAASQDALAEGMTPAGVFEMAARLRRVREVPLVLMTCYNPIWQFGLDEFARECSRSGVDGVIATDLPPEEANEWLEAARTNGVDTIFLLAPTSTADRVKKVVDLATGFVYCVSRMGVTGARAELPADLTGLVGRIRQQTAKPLAVGFGISRPAHVAAVCGVADGAVVGSAAVSLMGRAGDTKRVAQTAGRFVAELKAATRGVRPVGVSQ